VTEQYLLATMKPEKTGERIAEVTWYSGASVSRYDWNRDEEYELSFDLSGADLSRLNSGSAPILLDHWPSVENTVGVIQKAWVENGAGMATVRFTERETFKPIWDDMLAGIIGNVSMGVSVRRMERVDKKNDPKKKYMAMEWEPREVSLVAIGADPNARAKVQLAYESRAEFLRATAGMMLRPESAGRQEFAARAEAIIRAERMNRSLKTTLGSVARVK